MSDCMTFPDTVEEFMEQYKVVDTEHVYSNGTELVPIFRMTQWFDHLPSAQPEIITCEHCIYQGSDPISDGRRWCKKHGGYMLYCSEGAI